METFCLLKEFVDNPDFAKQRKKSLKKLDSSMIDAPIIDVIKGLSRIPYCFTMQSCYGHFLYEGQNDEKDTCPLPKNAGPGNIDYRIAYIALCIRNDDSGHRLVQDLQKITAIDLEYVQFGCADWFWQQQVNSYALQVEPKRYMYEDKITIGYPEALHIEKIRNIFFDELRLIVQHETERLRHNENK